MLVSLIITCMRLESGNFLLGHFEISFPGCLRGNNSDAGKHFLLDWIVFDCVWGDGRSWFCRCPLLLLEPSLSFVSAFLFSFVFIPNSFFFRVRLCPGREGGLVGIFQVQTGWTTMSTSNHLLSGSLTLSAVGSSTLIPSAVFLVFSNLPAVLSSEYLLAV